MNIVVSAFSNDVTCNNFVNQKSLEKPKYLILEIKLLEVKFFAELSAS